MGGFAHGRYINANCGEMQEMQVHNVLQNINGYGYGTALVETSAEHWHEITENNKRLSKNLLVPDPYPEAATVVQLIFQLAAEGKNAPSIAKELYKRGIPTPAEYKIARGQKTHDISRTHGIWCDSTIVRYLADERYTGTYIIGKRAVLEVGGNNSRFRSKWYIIPDHHPAIVDKALFDKVQETVRRFSQPHKKQRDYLLKGIVFCGCCDHALSYVANKQPYSIAAALRRLRTAPAMI